MKRIGEYAFSGCYNLTGNLEFPSTLKQIGRDAFKGCSGFTGNLILPEGLKTIEKKLFTDAQDIIMTKRKKKMTKDYLAN